jgi:hypothetical protein
MVRFLLTSINKLLLCVEFRKRATDSCKRIMFEEIESDLSCKIPLIEFCGEPFIAVGRQVLECSSGVPRKQRAAEEGTEVLNTLHWFKKIIYIDYICFISITYTQISLK